MHASTGRRALIVLDEFQDVARVEALDAILRSHIQHQGPAACYVFSGSEPGLMRTLFEERERPLYGQAVPMRLGRLADADIAGYLVARFGATNRAGGDAVNPLLATAEGHPQRAMLLAHRLWARVGPGERATGRDWQGALDDALAELGPEFDAHWRRLSTVEQKTLRSVMAGGGSPYRRPVLERLGLHKASAQSAIRNLLARAELEQLPEAGGYRLVDPLLRCWIERMGADPVP
jgi:hypothetical protein